MGDAAVSADVETTPVETPLESVDWTIPCGYNGHDQFGLGDMPAAWAVWLRNPRSCGCVRHDFLYVCEPCWSHVHSLGGLVRCPQCDATRLLRHDVVRVESLR